MGMRSQIVTRVARGKINLTLRAVAALITSAVALAVMAGGAPAIARAKTPKGRVTLAEWNAHNKDVSGIHLEYALLTSSNGPSVPANEPVCQDFVAGGAPQPYTGNWEAAMRAMQAQARIYVSRTSTDLVSWGKGLAARARSYRSARDRHLVKEASKAFVSGGRLIAQAFTQLAYAYEGLSALSCDQSARVARAEGDWTSGYGEGSGQPPLASLVPNVIQGLQTLKKTFH